MDDALTSTDLVILRKQPKRFTWGKIRKFHDVDVYTVVEYLNREGELRFHVYVNGRCTNNSTYTLDGALVLAIGFNRLGRTSEADYMARAACKLLGVTE